MESREQGGGNRASEFEVLGWDGGGGIGEYVGGESLFYFFPFFFLAEQNAAAAAAGNPRCQDSHPAG